MKYIHGHGGKPIRFWIGDDEIEDDVADQMKAISSMPFIFKNGISCMPDVHYNKGGVSVGSVIPTIKAVIPANAGCDLGCGMIALKTSLTASDLPDSLRNLRLGIESFVPIDKHTKYSTANFHWDYHSDLMVRMKSFMDKEQSLSSKFGIGAMTIGTLGSGNHFCEVCVDENDSVWIMIHTGSRGMGGMIGNFYISKARDEMKRYFIDIPDVNLSYLVEGTKVMNDYMKGIALAQEFASVNRQSILRHVISSMQSYITKPFTVSDKIVDCHHNYISVESHFGQNMYITRKGAIDASLGKMGIIPGSMGAKSYIVRGLGEESSYRSCSHGAGRIMSRNKARTAFTVEDLKNQTVGVECKKDESVLDEIPGAYKDIDQVMENQKDLVEIVHTLKAVLCIKG